MERLKDMPLRRAFFLLTACGLLAALALAAAHASPTPFRCVAALRGGGHGPAKGTPAQVPPPAPRRAKDKVKGQGQGKILKDACNALNGHSGAK